MLNRANNPVSYQPFLKAPVPTYQIPLLLPNYAPAFTSQYLWAKLDVPNMERVSSSSAHMNSGFQNQEPSKLEDNEENDCLKSEERPHLMPSSHHQSMPALPLLLKHSSSSTKLRSQMSSSSILSESGDDKSEDYSDYTNDSNLYYVSTNASAKPSPVLLDQGYSSSSESISASTALSFQSQSTPKKQLQLKESSLSIDIRHLSLDFEDLNDCVAALLKKSKDENGSSRDIKRRQRKNKDQIKMLEIEFKKNNNWTREYIKKISQRLGLRECQVYKWHWDQRKKEGLEGTVLPQSQATAAALRSPSKRQ